MLGARLHPDEICARSAERRDAHGARCIRHRRRARRARHDQNFFCEAHRLGSRRGSSSESFTFRDAARAWYSLEQTTSCATAASMDVTRVCALLHADGVRCCPSRCLLRRALALLGDHRAVRVLADAPSRCGRAQCLWPHAREARHAARLIRSTPPVVRRDHTRLEPLHSDKLETRAFEPLKQSRSVSREHRMDACRTILVDQTHPLERRGRASRLPTSTPRGVFSLSAVTAADKSPSTRTVLFHGKSLREEDTTYFGHQRSAPFHASRDEEICPPP